MLIFRYRYALKNLFLYFQCAIMHKMGSPTLSHSHHYSPHCDSGSSFRTSIPTVRTWDIENVGN